MTGLAGAFVYGLTVGFIFGFSKAWRPRLAWGVFIAIAIVALAASAFLPDVPSGITVDTEWIVQTVGIGIGISVGGWAYNSEVADV